MSDVASVVCRIKLERITEKWLGGLREALIRGGCHQMNSAEIVESRIFPYSMDDDRVALLANEDNAVWDPGLAMYYASEKGNVEYEMLFSNIRQKNGYVKLVMDNDLAVDCFEIRQNAEKFYELVASLTSYLQPLYGCVVRSGYETIHSRFLGESMGELTYGEILNSGYPRSSVPILPHAIVLGARGKEAILGSLERLDKLCKKVYVSEKNVLLTIDDIWYVNENEEKIRKILTSKLAGVREE